MSTLFRPICWVERVYEFRCFLCSETYFVSAGPRRWLWRRTVGRFRSEEAVYKSAERQYQTLAETLDGQVCFSRAAELHNA